ncbi:TonB-dependent receptor [Spongiibacter sp. KMU-158]|uniref:TonB-dependent receptor n=1 Tax=Spongiibacter pelagi TaxID=2760804 RepID=A0A927BZ86_9GAMM|nr:TonB-dependent receptor [Spongiibacter pelagi]MBD2858313.1 TonB-dependent receptor [Spongiibacter pelagi]
MKKPLFFAGLAAFCFSAEAQSESAQSETQKTELHPLEHVLVTIPVHKKEARTALPVTVLSGDALREQAAMTLGDTLNGSPGLASSSFGPAVGQPVIRGQQGPRVAVLQNGLPALDVSTNSADHALSVEPVLAESIEVLRGPSTLLYGGGAIGGVVNVIDNRVPGKHINGVEGAVELRRNSVDNGRAGVARLDMGNGTWVFHLDALYRDWEEPEIPGLSVNERYADAEAIEESSDGVIGNADGRTRRFTLGSAYHFDGGYAGISYSELRNLYGIPSGVHHHHEEAVVGAPVEPEHEEEEGIDLAIEQRRWDVAGDVHNEGFWELLRWRGSYSEYQHQELEGDGAVGTTFSRDAWALRTELSHREVGNMHGVVGLQYLQSDFSALGEESFVPETENRNLGIFWLEDYHLDRWQFEAGLRVDRDELDSAEADLEAHNYFGASGSLAAIYDLNSVWSVSASYAESRRAPGAEERYSNIMIEPGDEYIVHGATGSVELGNPDLGREKSANIELGLRADMDRITAKLNVFSNQFSDFIYLQNTGLEQDEAPILSYQQQDADFVGVEYELKIALLPASYNNQIELRLYGDRISAELASGEDVPRLPPSRNGLALSWSYQDWSASIDYLHASKQDKPGANENPTESYNRVDADISWRWQYQSQSYIWSLKARNLGDEEIRSSSSFIRDAAPEPGRSLELAFRWEFGV